MEQHPDSPTVDTAAPAAAFAPDPAPPHPLPATAEDGAPPPEAYDPADYRWVPVRRRPRYDGWTEEKQRRFIEMLADTGLVGAAAKAVGLSRESAYRLRRSPHGAAFARAWDAARHHAGGTIEDVAFERAIEGAAHPVFDEYGQVVCTRRVHNDRLLMFLLRHLKPDRYGGASAQPGQPAAPPAIELEASLRAMEPQLPSPPDQLLGADTLADELELADVADGALPRFFSEQRPARTESRLQAEAAARGERAWEKSQRKEGSSGEEFTDMCRAIDPTAASDRRRARYR